MTRTRAKIAAALSLPVVLAGCGSPVVEGSPIAAPGPPVAAVDPCTVLSEQELASVGQSKEPREKVDKRGETGCRWLGPDYGFDLTVDPDGRLQEYVARKDTYVRSRENSINGRPGFLSQAFSNNSECAEFMELGSGLFNIRLSYAGTYIGRGDPCVDVEKVAKVVEPKLPK